MQFNGKTRISLRPSNVHKTIQKFSNLFYNLPGACTGEVIKFKFEIRSLNNLLTQIPSRFSRFSNVGQRYTDFVSDIIYDQYLLTYVHI